ncbi:MAG TPA: hypothetical protein PLG63_06695, partial [bacterium]|nr:hypothetical protein [bacterium]
VECIKNIDGCNYWVEIESCGENASCSNETTPAQCISDVVYSPVRDIVQDSANTSSIKKNVFKGNEFTCNYNATIQNVEMYLDPSWDAEGDTTITFAIYEKNNTNWTKIFDKQISTSNLNVGEQFFLTGYISVEIVKGKNYAIGAMFDRDCKYFSGNTTGQEVNFGLQVGMVSKENLDGLPTILDEIYGYTIKMAITSKLINN